MRPLRSLIVTAATTAAAASLVVAGPASARTLVFHDRAGDTDAPSDITRVVVDNATHGSRVIVTARMGNMIAGDSATLVPDTAYTRARLNRLYGGRRDFAPISTAPRLPRDPQYETYVRHAPCDAEGKFRFDQVADGAYVVVAALRQPGEKRAEGVSVRQAVSVHGGETRDIVLTH